MDNRLTGSSLSSSIVIMSKRKNNTSEIEFPEKGSEFVLTTEKIGKLLVRNNLKKLGRDILSNMCLLNEPLSLLS